MKPALLFFAVAAFFTACAHASPPGEADPWSAPVGAAEAQADLDALYEGLKAAHYDLFANRSRQEYNAQYLETRKRLAAPISRFDLYLELQKFTAFGDVAHARIDFPTDAYAAFRDKDGRAFPIYPRIVNGRAYVGEDYTGADEISPGDKIVSIDGIPMSDWLARSAQYISADTPYIAHSLIEFSFPMYLWALTGERAHFDLELADALVRSKKVRVDALTQSELRKASENTPKAFALQTNVRIAKMIEHRVAYLRPGPFYNFENPASVWDASAFSEFIDDAFASFIEEGAETLVIDLRDNPGGDNSFSDLMIAWIADEPFRFASSFIIKSSDVAAAANQARLDDDTGAAEGVSGLLAKEYARVPRGRTFRFEIPYVEPRNGEHFDGDVYVLINRHSYSNAVNVAAIFQDYGWGVIAGEKTADFATTYGAMESFTLPNSGFAVGFPKAHIIRPSGDPNPDGVTPDLPIETPIVPARSDVALEEFLAAISDRKMQ